MYSENILLKSVEEVKKFVNLVSSFDVGKKPSRQTPERFYHGFVLGLIVDLQGRYIITSNRESGFGRYDVMLEPKNPKEDDGMILEFKVQDTEDEKTLRDTVEAALAQIIYIHKHTPASRHRQAAMIPLSRILFLSFMCPPVQPSASSSSSFPSLRRRSSSFLSVRWL